jgi:protein-tyrosine phosphatase
MPSEPTRILFVCLGNICRSPLAEGIFLDEIQKRGLKKEFAADSAGTAGYHIGEDPDHRSIRTAENHGIHLNHKGRKFVEADFDRFDYILAMDKSNKQDILSLSKGKVSWEEKVFKLREFDPMPENGDVPDPYYGGIDGFEKVFQMLERSIGNFIDKIKK